ncbi:MAG TPA: PBP1A family penicillin-binding protein [Candidatus Xenobia bacterium]
MARLRGRPRRSWWLKGFLGFLLLLVGGVCFAGGFVLSVVNQFSQNLPDVDKLRTYEPSETTNIYSADGKLIATLFKENRIWARFDKIPQVLKDAFIATEDARFYEHSGVDPVGIARAAVADLEGQHASQGASTITMQLTRGIFLSPEVSAERKIREILLAMQIEKRFTKDEIFELYMNQIYFGSGAYGVEAAAHTYFGKKLKDLTLDEAAVIAGLPAAPSEYSPLVNPKAAKERQIWVLTRMQATQKINHQQMADAIERPIVTAHQHRQEALLKYPYFTTYVIHELSQRYPEDVLYRGGLRVYTTLDTRMQKQAQQAVVDGIANRGLSYNAHQSALVCVENGTGFIKAMVGGTKWSIKNQFNRAWQSTRQPGSSFKIFVYSAAMEDGYTPDSIITDAPVSFKVSANETYTPKNSDGRFWGSMPLWRTVQFSRDIPAIRMANQVGLNRVIDVANHMGIKERIPQNLSIALGAVDVTPLEMASAFTVIPQLGIRIESTPIKLIKDFEGNIIEDNRNPYNKESVLSEATCSSMISMMRKVIEAGTGTSANIGRPACGKTGTTDQHRDAWFVGFSPEYSTAVWVGNDDYSRMAGAYGGDVAAPIWGAFMKAALAKTPVHQFGMVEKGKIGVLMCKDTKCRAASTCPDVYREFFSPDALPERWCRRHSIDVVGGGRFAGVNLNRQPGAHMEEVELGSTSPAKTRKPAAAATGARPDRHDTEPPPDNGPTPDENGDVKATPGDENGNPVDIHPPACPPAPASTPAPPPDNVEPPPPSTPDAPPPATGGLPDTGNQ